MINRNNAEAQEGSVAAVNHGNGPQHIDNSTTIRLGGLVNLAETATGAIVFDPVAMREAILSIDHSLESINDSQSDFDIIDVEKKNKLNGLTQEYYDEFISINYEPYFLELDVFLKQRENEDLQKKVHNIVASLNRKIFIKRKYFDAFEDLLTSIEEALLESEFKALQGKEYTISFFLYYLYACCLIGKKTDEEKKC
ncbi:ABC-three component system protein [Amphritea japonica]|uniref:ABC-three component system protein n=1 Tax=Amphritea japonica TaxID=452627 RepID=UPI00035D91B2|nr:ABC-three component system protein [Amphritea japonica]